MGKFQQEKTVEIILIRPENICIKAPKILNLGC